MTGESEHGRTGERIEIVRATEDHVERIVALAKSRALDGTEPHTARQEGFLVSAYGADTYRARLTTAEHFYVALKGSDVLGFIMAYSDDQVEPDEWLNRHFKSVLGKFLVIKQICVSRDAARTGIASMLYYHVLEQWHESPVIAAVVCEPPNDASARFHRKVGFQELTRLTPPDGRPRVVWIWRKPREAMLQAQYAISVDLYKHEDSTNWQKLNNFFYITAGLAAATAFTLSKEGAESEHTARGLAIIIAIIGFGASVAFSQMLRFGRRYLQARKQAVTELEDYMAWHGGHRIVSRNIGDQGGKWLSASPTGIIMVLLPSLVAVCWLAVLAVVITS
ncbi:GNAT family N-acetyltransferase [Streptomyces gobiensis]|uniref:GNAT family N-acetyltransferase n=1 Tax=Streptomyces gobiensis TaxID=2875706 RepID=UPI001E5B4BF7|nr:GNAT family N-acetyltransferase [Streptomyces gobiensis]UGY93997.1 GNAT family N-acetyltransferase [Streptomyces gobiensis]